MSPEESPGAAAPTYSFERFVVRKAIFEQLPSVAREPNEVAPEPLPFQIGVNVQLKTRRDRAEGILTLGFEIQHDPKWKPYRIEVAVSGVFKSKDATLEQFNQFCRNNAPAILYPFMRTIVYNLTVDAAFGAVRLNPMNFTEMLKGAWPSAEQTVIEADSEGNEVLTKNSSSREND
jgi:preprotein translocase subunit SecB